MWARRLLFTLGVVGWIFPTQAQNSGVEQLFSNYCQKCHGDHGQGGGAGTRTLLTDRLFEAKFDRPFFDSIKNGVPETGMEAFGQTLDDSQVWGLVGYIREMQFRAHRERVGSPRPDSHGVYASKHHRFRIERVIEKGLEVPWSVDFLPDGRMLVADRPGEVRIHSTGKAGGKISTPVQGTPEVRNQGQGGLMDVAVHPNYAQNGWIYLAFSHAAGRNGMTKIVRGKISDALRWTDEQVIFQAKPEHYSGTSHHFGCRIVFDPKDPTILFFCVGERGAGQLAQDITRPNGKIFRIRDDGSAAEGNPFAAGETPYPIWSYGHRNPQGLAFDLEGNLWTTEHGPRGGDELNLVMPGRNYGWPVVSFGFNYNGRPLVSPWPKNPVKASDPVSKDAMVMPVLRWLPSIAACGLDVMRSDASFTNWKGDLFAGGLAGQTVQRLRVKDGEMIEQEEIIHGIGRVRDVVCAPDGSVYVVLNEPDIVVRLVAGE
jgi:glucose/arabinose dehydrogenase